MSGRGRSSFGSAARAGMADESPDTPTVWKDTQHEKLAPRLDVDAGDAKQAKGPSANEEKEESA